MFDLINFMDFCKCMLLYTQKTPVCSIPQVNGLNDNRLWHHDWVLKGRPQKAQSFTSKDAEIHHFVGKLFGQIVQQFKNNVCEHTIVRNLGINSKSLKDLILIKKSPPSSLGLKSSGMDRCTVEKCAVV